MMGVRLKCLLVCVLWGFSISSTDGVIHQTLTHCCDLGKNYANSDVSCTSVKPPIDGVDKRDENQCLSTLVICCKTQAKENDCRLGINDAEVATCNSADGSERQSCCEACNLGKSAASSGSCENSFSLGQAYDKHYKACCQKHLPKTTTPKLKKDELSLGNLCEIENICAQICIPTEESYKCDCNPGFTLMADGNSCKEVTGPKNTPKKKSRCDANNPCAHNCVDTGIAIYCTCYDGYELDSDKRSCKDIDECLLEHDCHANETCVNQDGYYECVEEGNDEDYDTVECQPGFRYSWENKMCEDVNECLLPLTCLPSQKCINTEGSYNCTGGEVACPPGYFFKASTLDCADIDECVTGANECNRESQVCLNNKGSYTCVDKASKKTCPPGFMMHNILQICVDIDECAQDIPLCAENELCVNEEGGHNCVPIGSGPKPLPTQATTFMASSTTVSTTTTLKPTTSTTTLRTTPKTIATTSKTTTTTTKPTTTTTTRTTTTTTTPIPTTQKQTTPKPTKPSTTRTTPFYVAPTKPTRRPYSQTNYNRPGFPASTNCNSGYLFSHKTQQCEDINECLSNLHNCDHHQECENQLGGYVCNCKPGFQRDHITGACQDINECMVGNHNCSEGYRCDNAVGYFICARVANCGTGYTLNYETSICEDNDECALGTHNCDLGGRDLICRNTHGSFRCDRPYVPPPLPLPTTTTTTTTTSTTTPTPHTYPTRGPYLYHYPQYTRRPDYYSNIKPTRPISYPPAVALRPNKYPSSYPNNTLLISSSKKCLPGYYMDASGACQDIDECQSNPCPSSQNCLNYNGKYQCVPKLVCPAGYELNSSGEQCIDINECIRGVHLCDSSEICKNYEGFHRCECPAGHIKKGKRCVDLDECDFFQGRLCPHTSECVNTIGSYECQCKDGFTKVNKTCVDINECEQPGICGSKCHNTMGSYRCLCEKGFRLNHDNRTCSDVDECTLFSERVHCVGTCVNTPGSYHCGCPNGYRLGVDGHTCQDIDECKSDLGNACTGPDKFCFNTRGSFECASIACPKNYIRDRHQQSRCKLNSESCRNFGECSPSLADQISFHFFNIPSNYTITEEPVKLFKMLGPHSQFSRVFFKLDLANIHCPYGVRPAHFDDFLLDRQGDDRNSATISIKTSIFGPQQVELTLQMQIFNHNVLTNTVISKILLYVSQYSF